MASVATLWSGGADSTLAALLLEPFYDVTLCSCTFDADVAVDTDTPVPDVAAETAPALDLPLATVALEEAVAREAVARMVADGYPREGIQLVHEHALETVAGRDAVETGDAGDRPVDAVADGTRRDDRAPVVDRPFAQSLEDRRGVDYLRPLAGYGRSAVDDLADRLLAVERGPSERLATGDYETELRALMAAEHGEEAVEEVFPAHVQSRATGRR